LLAGDSYLRQVVHTHVNLSPNSIIGSLPGIGRRCPIAGKVTVGQASLWLCVTPFIRGRLLALTTT